MNHLSENTRGVILMVLSMAAFTFNDACMKILFVSMPLFQALFLRSLISVALLLALAHFQGKLTLNLPRRDWSLISMRTIGEIGATYFFLTALKNMPLANISALLQILPLAVTLAGVVFLRETIGLHRLAAIIIGFFGVMLIIRPGGDGFNIYSIYALIAVAFVILRDITARSMSKKTPSLMVAASSAIGITIFAGIGSISTQWVAMDLTMFALLFSAAIFIFGGYIFSVAVMRIGDIGFIAPFRYTSLLWSILLGFIIFGELLDPLTLLGSAIVVAMGIFSFYREHRAMRKTKSKSS